MTTAQPARSALAGGVTRADGTVVGGLYAAGRTALGVCSESNFSGLPIADTVFSGRRVARAALRLNEPHRKKP